MLFKESQRSLENQLAIFESKYKLGHLQKGYSDTPPPDWKLLYYYETTKVLGFYIEHVGYQRKGMNGNFGVRFMGGDVHNFALWEDFQYAYNCIDFYWTSETQADVELRRQKFKKSFLDTFELGASYINVSY